MSEAKGWSQQLGLVMAFKWIWAGQKKCWKLQSLAFPLVNPHWNGIQLMSIHCPRVTGLSVRHYRRYRSYELGLKPRTWQVGAFEWKLSIGLCLRRWKAIRCWLYRRGESADKCSAFNALARPPFLVGSKERDRFRMRNSRTNISLIGGRRWSHGVLRSPQCGRSILRFPFAHRLANEMKACYRLRTGYNSVDRHGQYTDTRTECIRIGRIHRMRIPLWFKVGDTNLVCDS